MPDLFDAIAEGRASMVTDCIKTFTEKGLELTSGAELDADLIVTATGLNLLPLGGMQVAVDGGDVELPKTWWAQSMKFQRQGSRAPWRLYQNYALDILSLRFGAIEDGAIEFSRTSSVVDAVEDVAA